MGPSGSAPPFPGLRGGGAGVSVGRCAWVRGARSGACCQSAAGPLRGLAGPGPLPADTRRSLAVPAPPGGLAPARACPPASWHAPTVARSGPVSGPPVRGSWWGPVPARGEAWRRPGELAACSGPAGTVGPFRMARAEACCPRPAWACPLGGRLAPATGVGRGPLGLSKRVPGGASSCPGRGLASVGRAGGLLRAGRDSGPFPDGAGGRCSSPARQARRVRRRPRREARPAWARPATATG